MGNRSEADSRLTHESKVARRGLYPDAASGEVPAESKNRRDGDLGRLFDSNVVGIMFADVDGNITEANDAFLEIVGYRRGDLPLRSDVMTPADWRDLDATKVQEVISTGAGRAWEKEYFAKDGSRVPILVGVARLKEGEGGCVCFVVDLTERKKAERQLLEHQDRLKALAVKLSLAEERERRRIARGMHDHVGQTLAMAKCKLDLLRDGEETGADGVRVIEEIGDHLAQAIEQTRTLTFELSSPVLYELGLESALRSLVERSEKRNGIRLRFVSERPPESIPDDLSIILYRIVRELLLNVVKHARASKAAVSIGKVGEGVRVAVEDDGVGFDPSTDGNGCDPRGCFGLFSIRAQLERVGGRLEIEPVAGGGSRVMAVVPLPVGGAP